MSLGKNLTKLTLPLLLLIGCSIPPFYNGPIGKEDVKCGREVGMRGYYNYLQITKNGDKGLVGRDLIEYFDWNQDGKIDTIMIERGLGDSSVLKKGKETEKIFEIGQREYDKYTKIKIPEAMSNKTNEIIKVLTN